MLPFLFSESGKAKLIYDAIYRFNCITYFSKLFEPIREINAEGFNSQFKLFYYASNLSRSGKDAKVLF